MRKTVSTPAKGRRGCVLLIIFLLPFLLHMLSFHLPYERWFGTLDEKFEPAVRHR